MSPSEAFTAALFGALEEDERICYVRKTDNGWIQQAKPFTDPGPDYFCISTVRPQSPRALRLKRRKEDLHSVRVLVCDDVGTKAQVPPIEPTYILETSEGNFQYGFAIEPCEPALFEACMQLVAEAGYTDPGTLDAGRVMRTPDSINDKPGKNRFAAKLHAFDKEKRWSIRDLTASMGLGIPEVGVGATTPSMVAAAMPEGVFVDDPVFDWLQANGYILRDAGDGFWFIQCPWAHMHKGDPREDAKYSPLGHSKYPMVRGFTCFHSHMGVDFDGDDFLKWIRAQGGPDCKRYDRTTVNRALDAFRLAQPAPPPTDLPLWYTEQQRIDAMPVDEPAQRVSQIAARYAFSGYEGAYFRKDTKDMVYIQPKNMPLLYSEPIPTTTPAGTPTTKAAGAMAMGEAEKVDLIDFRPGKNLVFAEHGYKYLNTYRPPVHSHGGARETSAFDDLLARVACLDSERWYLLAWLAYKLQHPWVRGPGVLSLSMQEGEDQNQGSGRGTFIRLLRALFGERYITELSFDALAGKNYQSQYTDWMAGTLWAVVSEAKDTSAEQLTRRNARVSAYERVKDLTDPGMTRRQIVRKGLPNTDQHVYTSLLIASNHADVMEVPRDDRRLFVCRSALASEVDEAFWTRIHQEIGDSAFIAALYHRLMGMDTGVFQPYAPVPMTETKQILFDSTETELDDHIEAFLEWIPGRVVALRMISALWTRYEVEKKVFGVSSGAVYNEVKRRALRPIPSEPKWQVRINQYSLDKIKNPKAVPPNEEVQVDRPRPRLLDGRSTLSREMLIAHCQRHLAANHVFLSETTQKRNEFIAKYSANWK